ncbi:MAG: DNA internalization-related competence protein ComEC/Rec2 [Acidovorax sp.]
MGTAAQLAQPALWAWGGYAGLMALGLLLCFLPWRAGLLAGAAVAVFGLCGLRAAAFQAQALDAALEGRDLRVTGMVAAMPQTIESAFGQGPGQRFRFEVESAPPGVRLPPLIDLAWFASASAAVPGLHPGQRWDVAVRLKAPHGARNPGGFDYELWLWEQGVQATGTVRTGHGDTPPRLLAATWSHPVEQARQRVRDAIVRRLAAQDARAAGVVAALVTGDQRAIAQADWDLFRATGVAHLMSISGLHITLFAWVAAAAVGWCWRRSARLCLAWPAQSAALAGGVLLALAYALFSGWGVPAQRTVLMLAVVAGLRLGSLRWPWPLVWLLACAVVVLADPWALLAAGFWLSFVAVGVLFASNLVAASAYPVSAGGRFVWIFHHAKGFVREQWVATLALTPLTLLLFGQVSVVGALANLVAIPWVTLVVTPLALGGLLWPALWGVAAASLAPLMALLHTLAAWPGAVLALPAAPLWAGVAAVAGGALLVLRWPWQLRLLGLPWLLPALCWWPERPAPGRFELLAADVGQGTAVLVQTARHALLYDAGPRYGADSDAGDRVLAPLLRAQGVRLDTLMLSHRDTDHTGGAAAVLAAQPGAALTGSIASEANLLALRPATPCVAGQRWQWDGVDFELLHPLPEDLQKTGEKSNALSCVLRIRDAQGTAALLVGDIERPQEQALLARGAPLSATVLLAPHHGSKTSSSAAFLDAVAPRIALVQSGYRNRFGHPAPEVLGRYRERGVAVVSSPACGAALWKSADPQALRCERAANPRYWQHNP